MTKSKEPQGRGKSDFQSYHISRSECLIFNKTTKITKFTKKHGSTDRPFPKKKKIKSKESFPEKKKKNLMEHIVDKDENNFLKVLKELKENVNKAKTIMYKQDKTVY